MLRPREWKVRVATYALCLTVLPDSESRRKGSEKTRRDCLGRMVLSAVEGQDVVKENKRIPRCDSVLMITSTSKMEATHGPIEWPKLPHGAMLKFWA